MDLGMVLIKIAKSQENINFSEEVVKEILEHIDWIVIREDILLPFQETLLQQFKDAVQSFSSLGMTYDEYWEHKRKKIEKSYTKEQQALSFHRPAIRHQVINRKPRHLIKKIIR